VVERVTECGDVTGRRWRLASPTAALVLGLLSLLALVAVFALEIVSDLVSWSSTDVADSVTFVTFVVAFTAVGVVVARREPRNPMGWLLIALAMAIEAVNLGSDYAYLDYIVHHGTLPLGHVAALLSASWIFLFLLLPLIILLFPDGRLGSRWRWPLRVYVALFAVFVAAGTLSVAVADFGLRTPVDGSGNLIGLNRSSGSHAWFEPAKFAFVAAFVLLVIASIVYQFRRYRRAGGERREQLKWLAAAAAVAIVCLAISSASGSGSTFIGGVLFTIGLALLPLGMGVGILKYRLYEIDRLVSRTLSYAIVTALLVGTFIGLVALSTNTLALSGRVGVAASTLAAAALFNPLRVRVQRLVDRRFNRARYDAEATVAAFTARLRDAVEIDAVRTDLLDAVNRAVQPTHASLWIRS
jgi:ABC-type Co2+ transport system permease subunit